MTDEEKHILRDVTDRLTGERTSHLTFSSIDQILKVRRWDGMRATYDTRGLSSVAFRELVTKARGFANLGPNGLRATAIMELETGPL